MYQLILLCLFCLALPIGIEAQDWFEAGSKPDDYSMGGDPTQLHGTDSPAFIRSEKDEIDGFGTWMTRIEADDYRGQAIYISAMVKSTDVLERAGLWTRVDGPDGTLTFDNMGTRPITGTTEWQEYYVILDVPEEATGIFYGILLTGTGEVLFDGLEVRSYGRTWLAQNTDDSVFIYCVESVDEQIVWAGGAEGTFFLTTDGGQNWMSGSIEGAESLFLLSVQAFDENTAYFVAQKIPGWGARIYATRDGGETWHLQYENNKQGAFFNGIDFWDENTGIAVGDPVDGSFTIITTSDAGETWTEVPSDQIPPPLQGEFAGFGDTGGTVLATYGSRLAWFGTGYVNSTDQPVRILRTDDRGATWTAVETPYPSGNAIRGIGTIAFRDSLNGLAGGSREGFEGALLQTSDGGVNWTVVETFPPLHPATIAYIPGSDGQSVFVTSLQGSAYSNDAGMSWDTLSTEPHLGAGFASRSAGWAVNVFANRIDKFEGFMTTKTGDLAISINPFIHVKSFPNPFKESTTLLFTLPKVQSIQLDVLNMDGGVVNRILNELRYPGTHRVDINLPDLSAGMYIVRLRSSDFQVLHKILCLE